jgi:hypothetical protein
MGRRHIDRRAIGIAGHLQLGFGDPGVARAEQLVATGTLSVP